MLSGGGFYDGPITRLEEIYRLWCVLVCDIDTSRMRKPWHPLGHSATGDKNENKCPPYNIRLCLSPGRPSVTRVASIDIWSATRNLSRKAGRNKCKVPNDNFYRDLKIV